jgi:hypothetical protein
MAEASFANAQEEEETKEVMLTSRVTAVDEESDSNAIVYMQLQPRALGPDAWSDESHAKTGLSP